MAVGTASVGCIDSVDTAIKDASTRIDLFGVGGIRRRELGGDGKAPRAKHAFEPPRRAVPGKDRERLPRLRLISEDHLAPQPSHALLAARTMRRSSADR